MTGIWRSGAASNTRYESVAGFSCLSALARMLEGRLILASSPCLPRMVMADSPG